MNVDEIRSIENAGPKARARRITFTSGETLILAATVVRSLDLQPGSAMPHDEIVAAAAKCEAELARERALAIVGYRERSRAELTKALCDEGYSHTIVASIVDRFAELALVDDVRYAHMYARSRLASGRGRRLILRELTDRGIDETIAIPALDEATDSDEVARARMAIHHAMPIDRKERERLLRRLLARGFDMSTALSAIEPVPDDK